MVLANLIRETKRPLRIAIIDPSPHAPLGVAYSTPCPEHLLNVPADRMGAFADNPKGFFEWLQSGNSPIGPNDFAPRMLYGEYLRGIFEEALRQAEKKNISVTRISAEVRDVTPGTPLQLKTSTGETLAAASIVLCTGNYFSAFAPPGRRHITDVWHFDAAALAQEAPPGLPVVLIGTGLTAVDVLCSLEQSGWQGNIIAVSRHGTFPRPHLETKAPEWPQDAWNATRASLHLSQLFRAIRQQVKVAAAQQVPWQKVFDSLRPHTSRLWQSLPVADQRRVFARYMTLWNIHRHRMPAGAERMINAMKQEGRLTLQSGRVVKVEEQDACVIVRYRSGTQETTLRAALAFDCTGPRTQQLPPLVQRLVEHGLVARAANGVGLALDAQMKASPSIYAIGSMAVGMLLESTAVPTLREQAQAVAAALA